MQVRATDIVQDDLTQIMEYVRHASFAAEKFTCTASSTVVQLLASVLQTPRTLFLVVNAVDARAVALRETLTDLVVANALRHGQLPPPSHSGTQ